MIDANVKAVELIREMSNLETLIETTRVWDWMKRAKQIVKEWDQIAEGGAK